MSPVKQYHQPGLEYTNLQTFIPSSTVTSSVPHYPPDYIIQHADNLFHVSVIHILNFKYMVSSTVRYTCTDYD